MSNTHSNKRASHIRNLFFWQHTEPITDATVLITGAASGIAKALALIYAERGCKLSLCDYNKEGLIQTLKECSEIRKASRPSQYVGFGPSSSPIVINTSDDGLLGDEYVTGLAFDISNADSCKKWIDLTVERFTYINVLILCAGIGAHNVFADTSDLTMFRRCIDINYYGYLYCTQAAYPHLIRSKGILTAITSFSGEVGLPYRTAYCASKFAVTGFLEALRAEMEDISKEEKFDIVIVCPPTTNTNLRNNSLTSDQSLKQKHEESTNENGISVDDCASCIVDATDRRLRKAFFPLGSAIAVYARPLIPDYIDQKIWSKARL
jgi:NAD(P)-dependent dehydrogenase (short-subunit alcohol dehydrogenase family)